MRRFCFDGRQSGCIGLYLYDLIRVQFASLRQLRRALPVLGRLRRVRRTPPSAWVVLRAAEGTLGASAVQDSALVDVWLGALPFSSE